MKIKPSLCLGFFLVLNGCLFSSSSDPEVGLSNNNQTTSETNNTVGRTNNITSVTNNMTVAECACKTNEISKSCSEFKDLDGQPFTDGLLQCDECDFDVSECSRCGDGMVSGNEVCDGVLTTDICPENGSVKCANDCKSHDFSACYEFTKISAGGDHTCTITPNKKVICWGENRARQLEPPADDFKSLSSGGSHSCGIKSNDTLACWGADLGGQATPPNGNYKNISAGTSHTCGVRTDGQIRCWGFGPGKNFDEDTVDRFTQVSAGFNHSCGLKLNREITCWGNNDDRKATPPTDMDPSVRVEVGFGRSCAISDSGIIRCWGFVSGVPGEDPVKSLGLGTGFGCSLNGDGYAYCWRGLIPENRTDINSTGPIKEMAVGSDHTCVIQMDGDVKCWGKNDAGQATPP